MTEMPFGTPPDFLGAVRPPEIASPDALWFLFRKSRLLTLAGPPSGDAPEDPRAWPQPSSALVPRTADPRDLGLTPLSTLYLGRLGRTDCYAGSVDDDASAPEGLAWYGLRPLFSVLSDAELALAGRAQQLLEWNATHRFCGRCASPTTLRTDERSRECPECGLVAYPRVSPAVMALVRRPPRRILLARSGRFPSGMHSALAGFVEAGETLEQTIEREVHEEVGVQVTNLRYFASQPWPFPHSLMIAFVADWASGEIQIDGEEIVAAEWFPVDALPQLPPRISIARRLIDAVAAEMAGA
jgi:NAD+ diphosphatase